MSSWYQRRPDQSGLIVFVRVTIPTERSLCVDRIVYQEEDVLYVFDITRFTCYQKRDYLNTPVDATKAAELDAMQSDFMEWFEAVIAPQFQGINA